VELARIEIREPGSDADGLLDCLRARATKFDVGIEGEADGNLLHVTDLGGSVDDLHSFLAIQLDACGRDAGLDWGRYLKILRHDEG